MTLVISQLRALSLYQTKDKARAKKKKCLSVKISKEPPTIHKFERDNLEYTFECIFDPFVLHDTESDHPDLFFNDDSKKRLAKPWDLPPYADEGSSSVPSLLKRLTSWHPKNKHNQSVAPPMSPV